jgi:hypothetical protein
MWGTSAFAENQYQDADAEDVVLSEYKKYQENKGETVA